MLFFSLLFMFVVPISVCFDLVLEGELSFGKDVLKTFANEINAPLGLKVWDTPSRKRLRLQLMTSNPFKMPVQGNKMVQYHVHRDMSKMDSKKYESMELIENASNDNTHEDNIKFKFNVKHHLSNQGSLRLIEIAYYIKNKLNPHTNINLVVKTATNSYKTEVKEYYDQISKQTNKYDIKEEFILLDLIESANNLLINEAKKLLNAIILETNTDQTKIDMAVLMKNIQSNVLEEKRDQLKYICEVLEICKSFPGYSDQIAELISDILQLTDNNFKIIIKNFKETITSKSDFFKSILRGVVIINISSKLTFWLNHLRFIREFFSILRAVITQRYKFFQSNSTDVVINTKAIRILLDLIDKAFEVNNENGNSTEIANTITSYKQWALGNRNDVDIITKNFINDAVQILNHNWDEHTKEGIKVLNEIIVTGTTKKIAVYENLFAKGSKFIRDKVDTQAYKKILY